MSFPTSLDNMSVNNKIVDGDSVIQAADINSLNVALDAVQAKVGINNSAVTTSLDYKVTNKVLKYDSGWFAVAANTSYVKAHSLAIAPDMVQVLWSDTNNGSGVVCIASGGSAGVTDRGCMLIDLDATNVTLRTGYFGCIMYRDGAGNVQTPVGGYYKIVALKFN